MPMLKLSQDAIGRALFDHLHGEFFVSGKGHAFTHVISLRAFVYNNYSRLSFYPAFVVNTTDDM